MSRLKNQECEFAIYAILTMAVMNLMGMRVKIPVQDVIN